MKKNTWLQRITAVLKGGDDAKLVRFQTKLEKYFDKQIKQREDSIETLRDKITDASDNLNDVIESVNLDRIATTEGAESYCKEYTQKVQQAAQTEKNLLDQIEVLEEEITALQELQATIFGEVETK